MVSQAVQLLRQGVWAALTGGWYHDPEQSKFTNSCHLYLWLFLLLLPMAMHLAFPPNTITAFVYCSSVTVLFTVIKVVSYRLHLMFDKGEVIQQKVSWKEGKQNKEGRRDNAVRHINLSNNIGDSCAFEELKRNGSTPTIHSSVKVQAILSHHSSGVLELPAQETIEDLKGVMFLEDQPALPVSSTSPCVKADILSASMALMSSSTTSAIVAKPSAMETFISAATSEKDEKVQLSGYNAVEDTPLDKGVVKKLPNLSLSQYDIIKAGISFESWSTDNSVIISEHLSNPKCFRREKVLDASAQDITTTSCPQCNTVAAKGMDGPLESPYLDDMKVHIDDSESEVAVALIDNSLSGDPLTLHEPIKIVITMSSTQNSTTDLDGSRHLQVLGAEIGSSSDPESGVVMADQPSKQSSERMRIPVITFELSDDSGGQAYQEASESLRTPDNLNVDASSNQCSGYESGEQDNNAKENADSPMDNLKEVSTSPEKAFENTEVLTLHSKEGPQSLVVPSYKTAPEKRHARVLSVDSGTDVFLSKNSSETVSDKEKLLPTSKSDLEAKEGQMPNESNFLEFVSLLESINTSKATASDGKPEAAKDKGITGDGCTAEKKEETPEMDKNSAHGSSKQDKPEMQTQDSGSINSTVPEPIKFTAHYQSTRQRQIIYRVTSQQDSSLLQVISGPEASMQEEMSVDAMHVFIDENGEIRSCYLKAGSQKEGNMQNPAPNYDCVSHAHETHFSSSSTTTSESQEASSDHGPSALQQQLLLMMARRTLSETQRHLSEDLEDSSCSSAQKKINRQFYKFIIFPGKWIKIWYDRLTLLALLDRTEDIKENVLAILLVILVSFLGFIIMNQGFCKDIWILLFCLIMASCQYSLLKSIQPDPASPIHGHNQLITYSRPVYFCILCGLILLLDAGSQNKNPPIYTVYGLKIFSPGSFQAARDHVIGFLFCFPVISLLGLFPQINTFSIYLLEQIDMLLFGGSAAAGMISALYSISRSVIVVIVLYMFCFNAVKEPWDAQHIPALFSAFCGLLVALSYHLSRQSSDPSVLMSLIQCKYFPHFLHQHLEDSQADPLPEKMRESVNAVNPVVSVLVCELVLEPELLMMLQQLPIGCRSFLQSIRSHPLVSECFGSRMNFQNRFHLTSKRETLKSDLIVCSVAAVLSFAVSASTVFLSLGQYLSIVLYALAWTVGFVTHYLIPQLRKHHPWLWISHPILKNKEYQQRELRDAAHLMWFERLYVWLQCFEKYILYPAIILNALTNDAFSISKYKNLTPHCDIFLITIAGMKLLRSSFCNPIHQFVTLSFTVVFFQCDYYGNSDNFLLNFFMMSIVFNKLWDLLQKMQFILTYIAPWQIAWGSSFHVFAQLFAIPHSAMLFFQTLATAIFSTPLSPFLGSVIFLTSYARPVKFWERNYNSHSFLWTLKIALLILLLFPGLLHQQLFGRMLVVLENKCI